MLAYIPAPWIRHGCVFHGMFIKNLQYIKQRSTSFIIIYHLSFPYTSHVHVHLIRYIIQCGPPSYKLVYKPHQLESSYKYQTIVTLYDIVII